MEGILIDKYSYGNSFNPYSPMSSLNHPITDGETSAYGSYVSHPRPLQLYSSLPSFSSSPFPLPRPPLLPLPPPSVSATLPSPGKKINATNTTHNISSVRSRDRRKKQRPAANSKKEPPLSTSIATKLSQPNNNEARKQITKTSASQVVKVKPGRRAEEQVYSLSPPPSSLPLPSFALMRPRTAASGDGGRGGKGSMHGGATHGLRRLLRL
ncbi:unnamed protein product [Musa acuminata subsp. burmannicoides]